jgi:hypothetical protein
MGAGVTLGLCLFGAIKRIFAVAFISEYTVGCFIFATA